MRLELKHQLSEQTTRKVADLAWASYQKKYSEYQPKIKWLSDNRRAIIEFTVNKKIIQGAIELQPGVIIVGANVDNVVKGLFAKIVESKAKQILTKEFKYWIKWAKAQGMS